MASADIERQRSSQLLYNNMKEKFFFFLFPLYIFFYHLLKNFLSISKGKQTVVAWNPSLPLFAVMKTYFGSRFEQTKLASFRKNLFNKLFIISKNLPTQLFLLYRSLLKSLLIVIQFSVRFTISRF